MIFWECFDDYWWTRATTVLLKSQIVTIFQYVLILMDETNLRHCLRFQYFSSSRFACIQGTGFPVANIKFFVDAQHVQHPDYKKIQYNGPISLFSLFLFVHRLEFGYAMKQLPRFNSLHIIYQHVEFFTCTISNILSCWFILNMTNFLFLKLQSNR